MTLNPEKKKDPGTVGSPAQAPTGATQEDPARATTGATTIQFHLPMNDLRAVRIPTFLTGQRR